MKYKILVYNNYSKFIEGEPPPAWFKTVQKGAWFSPKFQKRKTDGTRQWDGTINFLSKKGSFLTGLLPLWLLEHPETEVIDRRHNPSEETLYTPAPIKTPLRKYQEEAVREAINKKRGILWLATNAGKSYIIASICKNLPLQTTTVVTYGLSLIAQTKKTLEEELDEEVGEITGETKTYSKARIQIASINTLISRKLKLNEDVLIFDECHLASAKSYYDYGRLSHAFFRFGFSGTAFVEKTRKKATGIGRYSPRDAKLIGITGPVIFRYSNEQLIAEEFSAKPVFYLHEIPAKYTPDWERAQEFGIIKNTALTEEIKKILARIPKNEHALVLIQRIEHGEILSFATGVRFIYGETPKEERCYYPDEYRLIASTIFDLGMNLPIKHLVLAGGGRGEEEKGQTAIKLLQRIGRGLRKKENGENIIHIHDFAFLGNRYLEKHTLERIRAYEGFEIKMM